MEASEPRRRRAAIVCVDDEPAVLAAVARDLRRQFGERYRIVRATSGPEALEALKELVARGEQVALLVADQRMPGMAGTEYLVEARKLVPDAKRVLLTAYADTEAAIQAINEVDLDYYLLKPWDPPEEQLYPVVEDLLTTWEAGAALESGGVRVIGHRFSRDSHDLRDFLARNRVPMRWLDVERDTEARELLQVADVDDERLPVALLEDGTVLERPTVLELAERLGRVRRARVRPLRPRDRRRRARGARGGGLRRVGGPADRDGRARGARRPGRHVVAGSRTTSASRPGCPARTSRAARPTRRAGSAPSCSRSRTRCALRVEGAGRIVRALRRRHALAPTACSSPPASPTTSSRAPGFDTFTGKGIYYGAALTEARSCSDQHVVIIGGANSAGQAAVHFSGFARQVTMLVRGDSLAKSMSHYLIEQIAAIPNIDVRTQRAGDRGRRATTTCARCASATRDGEHDEEVDATFVFIGAAPRTDWLDGRRRRATSAGSSSPAPTRETAGWPLKRDPYLLETTVPGVFVAGDVRARSIKRVASAVGEGSMAVSLIHEYLAE